MVNVGIRIDLLGLDKQQTLSKTNVKTCHLMVVINRSERENRFPSARQAQDFTSNLDIA